MRKLLLIFPMLLLTLNILAQTPVLKHKVIHGPDSTRYNFLVTGEGFTAAQLWRLEASVDTLAARMFRATPFKEYQNFFNFHLIELASQDSGLVHPATAPNDLIAPYFPVNCFDTRLDYAGIHNLSFMYNVTPYNTMVATYYPGWDNYFHILNTTNVQAHAGYGTGAVLGLPGLNYTYHNTAMHEIGHAMGGLADEYWVNTWPAGVPNRDTTNNPTSVKWKNWLGTNGVGIDSFGIVGNTVHYRPGSVCRMRTASSPFCPVCIEGLIDTLYYTVAPIELATPQNDTVQSAASLLFTLKLIYPIPNTLTIKWEMNGNMLTGTDTFMNINNSQLQTGYNKLTAYVTDTTLLSRSYWPGNGYQFSKSWTIEKTTTGIAVLQTATGRFFYKLYPNPVQQEMTFYFENREKHKILYYELTTTDGKVILSGRKEVPLGDGSLELQLSQFATGIYLFKVVGDGVHVEEKIMKL